MCPQECVFFLCLFLRVFFVLSLCLFSFSLSHSLSHYFSLCRPHLGSATKSLGETCFFFFRRLVFPSLPPNLWNWFACHCSSLCLWRCKQQAMKHKLRTPCFFFVFDAFPTRVVAPFLVRINIFFLARSSLDVSVVAAFSCCFRRVIVFSPPGLNRPDPTAAFAHITIDRNS